MRKLVERAKRGDVEAFGRLVERFQDAVYGIAYAIVGSFHDAEDAAQEAFLQAWRDLGSLRDPDKFPGWLCTIVRNRCRNLVKGRRRVEVPIEGMEFPGPRSGEPERRAEASERRSAVLGAIRSLSEPNRLATALFYVDGYSVEEVAGFLDVPVGTVKRRLHDSRKLLKERMLEMVAEELKASKPGADFRALIEKAAALQGEKRYHEALGVHQEAVSVASQEGHFGVGAETYARFMPSYFQEGRALEFAEGVLTGVPSDPSREQMPKAIEQLIVAGSGFVRGKEPERAAEQAERVLKCAETLKGQPRYRQYRSEALSLLYRAAVLRGDEGEAARRLDGVYANLAAYEKELAAACPGLRRMTDTAQKEKQAWFEWAGNAYHNVACFVALARGDKVEALRLMRRAAELRDLGPTYSILAGLVLSVEGDRDAALGYFRKAATWEGGKYLKALKWSFDESELFHLMREDAEFLAALEP